MRIYKKIILFCLIVIAFILSGINVFAAQKTTIYFFWGQGCPHCAKEKIFLNTLKKGILQ